MTKIDNHSIYAIQLPTGKYYVRKEKGHNLETRIFEFAQFGGLRDEKFEKEFLQKFEKGTKLIKRTRIALADLEGNELQPEIPNGVEVERAYLIGNAYKAERTSDKLYPRLRSSPGGSNYIYGVKKLIPTKEEAIKLAIEAEKETFEEELVRQSWYAIEVITIEEEVEVK